MQAALGLFFAASLILDAIAYALCGYFVRFKSRRIVEGIALIISGAVLVVTTMNSMGEKIGGRNSFFLVVIFAVAAVLAVETTMKLHCRCKGSDAQPSKN